MRRLLVIRHAKAVAGGSPDIERPLADRGRADAAQLGNWLREQGIRVDYAAVSPSTRTRQTWHYANVEAGEVDHDQRIYRDTVDDLFMVVQEAPPDAATVALVGHNPAVQDLTLALDDGAGNSSARQTVAERFPTAGLAVFDVAGEWSDLRAATLLQFAVPRAHGS